MTTFSNLFMNNFESFKNLEGASAAFRLEN